MKTFFKISLYSLLALIALSLITSAILLGVAPHAITMEWGDSGLQHSLWASSWWGQWLSLAAALLVCAVVVPVVVASCTLLPLLIVSLVFVCVGAALGSPFILLALLVFIIVRNRARARTHAHAARAETSV